MITAIKSESIRLPAAVPGIELHLLNKRPAGISGFDANRVVLCVHGATFGAEAGFDFPHPQGGSWLEFMAARGFDAYLVDVRGYGRSTRPPAMDAPPAGNPPFADTADAVSDVTQAVNFILQRRGIDRLNLIGWSWGTAIMSCFTVANPGRVAKLVLCAPLYKMRYSTSPVAGAGAWRGVPREPGRSRGIAGIPAHRVEEISPRAWFDAWWDFNLSLDPAGAKATPPLLRAPNGVVKDVGLYWAAGKSPYDPARITVPTLLIVGEWDQDTPTYMAQDLFADLTHCPDKRLTILGEGTHAMVLEKFRMRKITAIQQFLEDNGA